ncbi:unnamed protein product [Ectocarpus sp. CCAP 1310/34]|nr:unnamed protein product [Ectocarpus sp. CCAP 1310/34]
MRALEMQRREEERQSKLKTAAEAKEERQRKWLTMTEEEKEVFVEEEKVAKKQEWIKKQAALLGLAPAEDGDGADGGIGDDKTFASAASSRERRRLSIKAAKVRRRKQEIEITAMEAEDERSKLENRAYREMLEVRLQRQIEMARRAAAMKRQMAAEVSAAGCGQTAASIVNSMDSGSGGGGGSRGGGGGDGDGNGSQTEAGSIGVGGEEGGGFLGGYGSEDTGGSFNLFDDDYVSSSESDLGEEDRAFAEDVGLPTGDVDLEDSIHSSDDEEGGGKAAKKAAKAKADAAAAAAAKAAETSWLGGGGGRWGGGGGIGNEQAKETEEETANNGDEPTSNVEAVSSPGSQAAEVGIGGVEEGEDGISPVVAPLEEEGAAPPAGRAGSVMLAGNGVQNGKEHDKNQDGERAKDKRRRSNGQGGKDFGNKRASSTSPLRLPGSPEGTSRGGRGKRGRNAAEGARGGLGGRRRMLSDDGEDSTSTEEETSSDEDRGGHGRAVATRKRKPGDGGGATKKKMAKKNGTKTAVAATLALAEAESLEEENPEVAQMAQQKKVLDRRMKHRLGRQRQRVIKRLRRAKEVREAEDEKIAMRLEQANQMAQLADAKAELAWLDAEGESRRLEKRLVGEREGLRKLRLFCQTKAREEITCREESVLRTNEARKRQAARDDAFTWHARCKEQEHRTLKWKIRVLKETKFFNGRVITGQFQRWETDWIYPHLHSMYFKGLVDIVVNRAELIGAERRMMKIHDRLVRTSQEIIKKETLVSKLWKKQRRRELIYLRRSELGKKIFGKSQKKYLRKVFEAWTGFHTWLRSMREAFRLKYGVLKQARIGPEPCLRGDRRRIAAVAKHTTPL